MYKIRDITG